MKKVMLLIFSIIFISNVFYGCNQEDNAVNCSHYYTTSIIDPTCSEKGYDYHTCILCGYSYKDNYINATGKHSGIGECLYCGLDFFNEMVDYMKSNGTYLSDFNSYAMSDSSYPFSILWSYKKTKNCLEVSFTKTSSSVNLFFITYYNDANGTYKWGMNYEIVSSGKSFQMEGVKNMKTLYDSTSSISYTSTSFPDYLITDGKQLAAGSLKSNAAFFQALLDTYGGSIKNWGYTNLTMP